MSVDDLDLVATDEVASRIPVQSVGTAVTEILRERIFTGQLPAGQRVPQDDLARELGVSRLPVREAVAGLARDGLLRIERHRGAFVEPIGRTDIEDHYRIFGQVHGLAAARAAAEATAEERAGLAALHRQLGAAETLEEQHRLNWQFHRLINVVGGSRRLQSIILGLTRQIPRGFRFDVPPASAQALAEHAAILAAVEEHDPDAAFEACVAHLLTEAELICALVASRSGADAETAPETAPTTDPAAPTTPTPTGR